MSEKKTILEQIAERERMEYLIRNVNRAEGASECWFRLPNYLNVMHERQDHQRRKIGLLSKMLVKSDRAFNNVVGVVKKVVLEMAKTHCLTSGRIVLDYPEWYQGWKMPPVQIEDSACAP